MATMKIKKDDMVQVIAGKDKGKEGKVLSVDKKKGTVIVEGVNKVFKHSKPSMANQAGGIIEMEAPMDISNVMYLYKGKPVRIGFEGTGKDKVRVAKVNGKTEKID
jgi:large subunit ribosomal protein L24